MVGRTRSVLIIIAHCFITLMMNEVVVGLSNNTDFQYYAIGRRVQLYTQ